MHTSAAVDEAHYPSRGPDWHGPHPHRIRVGNLSVVGTDCDRGTLRLQSLEDVSDRRLPRSYAVVISQPSSVTITVCSA
jgi:hypothetical protein